MIYLEQVILLTTINQIIYLNAAAWLCLLVPRRGFARLR